MTQKKETDIFASHPGLARERLYEVLAESSPELIFIIDQDDRVLFINAAAAKWLRREAKDVVGRPRAELFPPEVNEHQSAALREVLKTARPFRSQREHSFGGRTFWLDAMLIPLLDDAGKPYAVMGISRDITDLKRHEEETKLAKEFLDRIINSVPTPIFIKDAASRYILVNNATCNMIKRSREDILGHTDTDIFPSDVAKGILESDAELLRSGREVVREISFEVPGIGTRVSLSRKTLYQDPGGESFIVGVANDITGLRRMEDELARGQTLRSLAVFAGGIAHDFNNLLTAILGNINLARAKVPPESIMAEALADAETASQRAKDLSRQLLTFSKGGAPITSAIKLEGLLRDTAIFALRGTGILLETDIPSELWPVQADQSQVAQALQNILLNARDAMPEGGSVRLKAENVALGSGHALLREGRYVRVIIEDEGEGIPPETLPNIFDPYFTTKTQGSGLGLAVAYSVVRRHGGHIEVESRMGSGSSFSILLPAAEGPLAPPAENPADMRPGKGRILIMDDEEIIRTTAARILELCGYETAAAKDGAEAVELYRQAMHAGRRFSAVLLDMSVPGGMGGEDALTALKEIDPRVRAVASTGYSESAVLADFRRHGFSAVAPKPYDIAALSRAVADAVSAKEERP